MKTIKTELVVIAPDRQRKEFNAASLGELRQSLGKGAGLLHAIVLRGNVLVAGERRLRAVCDAHFMGETVYHGGEPVPHGEVPYLDVGELGELEAEEAELDENIKRINLTWQEEAAATQRLHLLRLKMAERDGTVHSVKDTAKEIHVGTGEAVTPEHSQRLVNDRLLVARNLEAVPEAAKAATLQEAIKIIKRSESRERFNTLGLAMAKVSAESKHKLFNESFVTGLCGAAHAGKYDIILSDPPYGMNADQFGDSGSADRSIGAHSYDDSYEAWKVLMNQLMAASWHVTKPSAHMYLFCDFDRFHELKQMAEDRGWKVFRTPIVMHKLGNSGRVPWPKHGPRRQYELVLYAYRGDKMVTNVMHDYFDAPMIPERMGHPAEKPVEGLVNLLKRPATPGDEVLDMCCGSGPIFEAGDQMGCKVTGFEIDPAYYGMAFTRLEKLK